MAQTANTTTVPTTAPWPATSTAVAATTAPSNTSVNVQRDGKSGNKISDTANTCSMFSRGNFAPLDHLSPSVSSQSSCLPPQPKFHARGKTSSAVVTSGTTTSSSSTMTSSTSQVPHMHLAPSPATSFTNADISRLIPHLEAIAGSLQNTPALEGHCLATLAQTHLLPALTQYDPDNPHAAEVVDALQSLPLVTPDGKTVPLSNSATFDSASLLASLDMNALMQNLASPELQGADPANDVHAQPVYPADFNSLKRLSQKATSVVESSSVDQTVGGAGGRRLETEMHSNQTRPLTTSFLLDHNFPMDIPPPTDLLPDHVRQHS